jgi:hypothetical protein
LYWLIIACMRFKVKSKPSRSWQENAIALPKYSDWVCRSLRLVWTSYIGGAEQAAGTS